MFFLRFLLIFFFTISVVYSYSQTIISGGSDNDIIGRLTKMPDGNLLCIVERNPDWGSGDFYSTISTDEGATWSSLNPVIIASGNQSTMSVIVTPDDSIRLFYASDESGYYKIYSISSIDGINWVNKKQINLGWTAATEIYDPHAIAEDNGDITMIYIKMGGACYVANYSSSSGWDQNMTLVQSGAYRARICKKDTVYLAAYHRNISGNYDIHVKQSTDLQNWSSEIDLTNNGNSHDAYCDVTYTGEYITYYAKVISGNYNIHRRKSTDGINWTAEEQLTNDNVFNTQPAFISDSAHIYLCYTHAVDYNTNNDIYFEKYNIATFLNKKYYGDPVIYYKGESLVLKDIKRLYFPLQVEIFSVDGRLLYKNLAIKNKIFLKSGFNLPGLYIYRIIDNNANCYTGKFIIK